MTTPAVTVGAQLEQRRPKVECREKAQFLTVRWRCLTAARSIRKANQASSLGPPGDDRERGSNERAFLAVALFPAALLRARCVCADPLALLFLSLPDARWPTGPRAGRPAALRRARVPFLYRDAAGGG